ncbi:MAG: LamG domain-containing protein [Armatimonadetes bacterium]|nr:LamG domain-containing protein [Armatimonadota bacterium]
MLASCGEFKEQCWFVQIMCGRIRLSLGGDHTLDTGWIEARRPYHVACAYDGAKMHVYVNDEEAGSRSTPVVDPKPWTGPLYMSQYHFLEPLYQFHGVLSDLRICAFAP